MKKMPKLTKLSLLLPCLLVTVAGNAYSGEYNKMQKQLNIMSKIIESSVDSQDSRKHSKINGIESTYLKGQGVVFTINSSSRNHSWGNYNFNFAMPDIPEISFGSPKAPKPPKAPRSRGDATSYSESETSYAEEISALEISEQITNGWEKATEGFERAMDSFNDNRDRFRDLREEQRDLSHEIRDLEREKRDLVYQQQRADKSSQAELTKQVKEVEKQRIKIEQARAKLKAKSAELHKQQQKQKAQQNQEREGYYQQLVLSLAETFCLYGNGLKSVPRNENVSLIVKSAGEKEGRRYKDKIFVFSKKDITDCSADKITVVKLLEKGKGYQF